MLPPKVELRLLSNRDGKATLRAVADSRSKTQPIIALRLMQDGRGLSDDQYRVVVPSALHAEKEWTIELAPGQHDLKVLAHTPAVAAFSNSVMVEAPVQESQKPRLHMLAVGVNEYRDKELALRFAVNDAKQLLEAFQQNCVGKENRHRAIVPHILVNADATRERVVQELKAMKQEAKPGDLAVFFFAGHGVTEKGQFYLLTVETDLKDIPKSTLSGAELLDPRRHALPGVGDPRRLSFGQGGVGVRPRD